MTRCCKILLKQSKTLSEMWLPWRPAGSETIGVNADILQKCIRVCWTSHLLQECFHKKERTFMEAAVAAP